MVQQRHVSETRTEVDRGEFAYMAIGVQCCVSFRAGSMRRQQA